MENRYRQRKGFSLIEVIIAVAILAILSMPILLYFTNSAIHSANGRHEQAADMAAQSIVEEIDAMQNLTVLEKTLQDGASSLISSEGWVSAASLSFAKNVSAFSDTDSHDERITTLCRPVTVNGQDYMARITLDYDSYFASGGSSYASGGVVFPSGTAAKYNSYNVPQLQEMHSEGSAVFADRANFTSGSPIGGAEEKSAYIENGIRSLFHTAFATSGSSFTSGSMTDIRSHCWRTFQIDIEEKEYDDAGNATKYQVKGSYILNYASQPSVKVVLGVTQVAADKLANIYMPFYPMTGEPRTPEQQADGVTARINMPPKLHLSMNTGTPENDKKIGISFIWQKGGADITAGTYKIKPEVYTVNPIGGAEAAAGIPAGMSFFSNSPLVVIGGSGDILYSEKEKRIALVTVDIFDKADYDADPTTAKVLVTSTTTKGV